MLVPQPFSCWHVILHDFGFALKFEVWWSILLEGCKAFPVTPSLELVIWKKCEEKKEFFLRV